MHRSILSFKIWTRIVAEQIEKRINKRTSKKKPLEISSEHGRTAFVMGNGKIVHSYPFERAADDDEWDEWDR